MTSNTRSEMAAVLLPLLVVWAAWQSGVMAQEPSARPLLTDDQIQQLVDTSAALQDQIQTARIRFKKLGYIGVKPEIPADQAMKIIESLEERVNTGGFDALDQAMSELLAMSTKSIHSSGAKWSDAELIEDGQRIRNRWSRDGVLKRDSAFDGEREVQFKADSRQANVFTGRSNWFMIRSSTLRNALQPELEWLRIANAEGRVEAADESGRLRVKSEDGMSFAVVDRSTGLRTSLVGYVQGDLYMVSRYLQLREYPGGIVFPGVTLECNFRSGMVSSIEVYAVEDAQFNIEIDAADFAVPVPAGVVVVRDKSTPGRHTDKLPAATPNALTDQEVFPDFEPPSAIGWPSLMIVALGIAALLCSAALWKAARR